MTRAKVTGRAGEFFRISTGQWARLSAGATDFPLVDDEVTVDADGVIVEVHHTRAAFGYESREEFTR